MKVEQRGGKMTRCVFCKRLIWPWQEGIVGLWHQACVTIFAGAYAQGVITGIAEVVRQNQSVEQVPEWASHARKVVIH